MATIEVGETVEAPRSGGDGKLYDAVVLEASSVTEIRVRFTHDDVIDTVPFKDVQKLMKRSRGKKQEPPKQLLKIYPLLAQSPLLPTVEEAAFVYGSCYDVGRKKYPRLGYQDPLLEHKKPFVIRLLDKSGKRLLGERSVARMTGWRTVALDYERQLGDFVFDPEAKDQTYEIRGCTVVDGTIVTPFISKKLGRFDPDALVALARPPRCHFIA